MPGDPPCWWHIFYEDENASESEPMTKSTKTIKSASTKASGAKTSAVKSTDTKRSRSKSAVSNGAGAIPRDIERLARHFGVSYAVAEERFTKEDAKKTMRMMR